MKNLPIIDELKSFKEKNYIGFFMPGHSQLNYKNDFSKIQKEVFNILKDFEKDIFSFDITEVNNFDNLSNPSGIIKNSQEIVAKDFMAKRAYFLVNGSTIGVLAMISSVSNSGDKIIIQKNSHKSVYNACKINNLDIVYINSKKNENFDTFNIIDIYEFERLLENNSDAKAVVITSPDYYGQNQNLSEISRITHKYNMYLIVDSAHAAHYNYSEYFKNNPIVYGADMSVISFHKTLPALNQTAVILGHFNLSEEIYTKLQEKINIFQTTSPSYILLASIEISNNIMKKYANELYKNLKFNIDILKKTVKNNLGNIKILENDDFSRIVISSLNVNIELVYNLLKYKYNIFAEMVNKKSIVFIANIFHTRSDFEKLYLALKDISENYKSYYFIEDKKLLNNEKIEIAEKSILDKKLIVLNYLKNNIGKKSEKTIYSYPPGLPIITEDEIITIEKIEYTEKIIHNNAIDLIT